MKDKILIIGGYGKVGSIISIELAKLFPNKIIVAGRNYKKANELSELLQGKVIPYKLDINKEIEDNFLADIKLVIMCIDQDNTSFVEKCIENNIVYIDITANHFFIKQVELLNKLAKEKKSSVILSVGLAPGITNLLAKYGTQKLALVNLIEIYILLGIGEKHGEAAYRWTFDNIHSSYYLKKNILIKSFSKPKKSNLLGERNFYTFNFSDQHTLAKTLSINKVITRMAFDSKILTHFVALCRKFYLTRIYTNKNIQDFFIALFTKTTVGSDLFAVKIIVKNDNAEKNEFSFSGNGEGKITAYVAIELVKYILSENKIYGVKHIHQIIDDIPNFLNKLKQYDNSIEINI